MGVIVFLEDCILSLFIISSWMQDANNKSSHCLQKLSFVDNGASQNLAHTLRAAGSTRHGYFRAAPYAAVPCLPLARRDEVERAAARLLQRVPKPRRAAAELDLPRRTTPGLIRLQRRAPTCLRQPVKECAVSVGQQFFFFEKIDSYNAVFFFQLFRFACSICVSSACEFTLLFF